MTLYEKGIELLTAKGMFPNDAAKVMTLVKADAANEPMASRWNDDIEGYPAALIKMLWVSVRRTAAAYIAEHQPLAWYRPLFDSKPMTTVTKGADHADIP